MALLRDSPKGSHAVLSAALLSGLQAQLSAEALHDLWAILTQVERADADSGWSNVEDWRLIPLQDQRLMRVKHRAAVFVAPFPATEPGGKDTRDDGAGEPPLPGAIARKHSCICAGSKRYRSEKTGGRAKGECQTFHCD